MSNFSMSKSGGKIFICFVMLSIFSVMVGVATQYPPQARFMPFVVGIPGIVMCVIQLALEIRAAFGKARDDQDESMSEIAKAEAEVSRITGRKMDFSEAQGSTAMVVEETSEGSGRREMIMWGCFLGLIAGILFFGFWISVPVFILAFLRFYARQTWRFSLLLTVGATAIFYFAFVLGLKAVLHEGFVIEAIKEHFDLY
jgi:hypothetical protein